MKYLPACQTTFLRLKVGSVHSSNLVNVFLGIGEAQIALSKEHRSQGLYGRSGDSLKSAIVALKQCIAMQDNIHCLWKLLGDAFTLHYHLLFIGADTGEGTQEVISNQANVRIALDVAAAKEVKEKKLAILEEGTKAYGTAIKLNASVASLYYDLGINLYYRARVHTTHPPVDAASAGIIGIIL